MVLPIIAAMGIVINILGISNFLNRNMKFVFHKLMIFLALWDLSILIMMIWLFTFPVLNYSYEDSIKTPIFRYGFPIFHISLTGTIYSTLALALER